MNHVRQLSRLQIVLGLVFIGLALFGSSLGHPFHFDDVLITADSNVTNPAQWRHFFEPQYLRQLTFFSFYLNNLFFGMRPAGFHAVNIALHVANAALLFLLLDGIVERWSAAAAALIFLIHPIQTEAVLYIYQRSVLLACFFSLLALLALRSRRYLLMVVLLLAAIEAKEAALAIPLLIALFYSRPDRPLPASRRVLYRGAAVALVFAAAAAFLYLLARAGEATVGIGASARIDPAWYFLTETRVFYTYLRLLFIPTPQSLEYDFAWVRSLADPLVWIRLAGIAALAAVAVVLYRSDRRRTIGFSILAFLVLLAPTSSWIPSNDAAFEHRLYLPMLAFSLLLAILLAPVRGRNVMLAVLAIVLSILTVSRERVWASDVTLWTDTVQHVPLKARAWFNLGGAEMSQKPDEARRALKRAIELQPAFPEAWYDLGVIESNGGNPGKAYEDYQHAVQEGPDYWPAWNNLGNVVFAMGERDRAIDILETTLRLNPDYWPAQYNIAVAEYSIGRYNKAIPRLNTVLDWRPDFKEARYLLAMALKQTGDQAAAEREWLRIGNLAGQPPMPAMIPSMIH